MGATRPRATTLRWQLAAALLQRPAASLEAACIACDVENGDGVEPANGRCNLHLQPTTTSMTQQ